MASYTIVTTREQEAGLNYSFEHFADEGQTKDQYLQARVSHAVLNPMFREFKGAQSIALDKSIVTIPVANEAKASQEIQAVIVANGGTLVPVGPPPDPIFDAQRNFGGPIPVIRGEDGNPIQARATNPQPIEPSGPDGGGDNEA